MATTAEITLKVSKSVKERNQKQITIKGLPERADKKHLSHKKGIVNIIRFSYKQPDGKMGSGELIVGDTNGIHFSHQTDEQAKHFTSLFTLLSEPQNVVKEGKTSVVNLLDREAPLTVEVEEVSSSATAAEDLSAVLGG